MGCSASLPQTAPSTATVAQDEQAPSLSALSGNKTPKEGGQTQRKDGKYLVLYTDFTCAYCFLEFLNLKRRMEELPPNQRLPIRHGAFQLDATLPNEGVNKYEFLQKFMPKDSLDELMDQLCHRFKRSHGLEMNRGGLLGNSAAAHRLQLWAQDNCDDTTSMRLKEELFLIHSCQGKSMGDLEALMQAARNVGLGTDKRQAAEIAKVLSHGRPDPKYTKSLSLHIKEATNDLNIKAVPVLVLVEKRHKGRQETKRLIGKSTDIENEEIGFRI